MCLNLPTQKLLRNFLKTVFCLLIAVCFTSLLTAQTTFVDPQTSPQSLPVVNNLTAAWQLKFSDEFNDNTIDDTKWTVQNSLRTRDPRPGLGIASWFWRPENTFEENGNLVLRVDKVTSNRMHCGAVNSNDKFESKYGYYECRVKIAEAAKGTHTAFWFQGDGQGLIDGTANDGAEIDVFESAWLEDYTKAVMHIDGYGSAREANTKQYTTPGMHQGYHTFGMFWTPTYINIYYDGVFKVAFTGDKWKVNALEWIFLSDGASFGYSGDNFTSQPLGELTRAYFDYVRVWQLDDYECFLATKEMEAIPSSPVNATTSVLNNTAASGGQILRLAADAVGDELILGPICHPEAGYYSYDLKAFRFTGFGKYKMSVEVAPGQWQLFDQEVDLYSTTSNSVTTNFGSVFLPSGNYRLKLTCTGKNPSSNNFAGSFDLITLQPGQPPVSCFISPTATVLSSAESESGVYNGAAALQSCSVASNGEYINLNVISVKRLDINNLSVPADGNYVLKIDYVSGDPNAARIARIDVNAVSQGPTDFPRTGPWCFQANPVVGAKYLVVALKAGNNSISILGSGSLLPLFDKFTVLTSATDTDEDGVPDACDADDDNDGILDVNDNCQLIVNVDQLDTDADGLGDVCDDDDDDDGILDMNDNCPLVSNTNQLDTDNDGIGNVCDDDDDNDGVLDVNDNCPLVFNTNQLDTDNDGIGNSCDNLFNMQSFTDKLLADLGNLGLNTGNTQALTVSIVNALSHCQQGNITSTINNLQAFINKVQAQSGKMITVEMANSLIASTTFAIQALISGQSDCGVSNSLRQSVPNSFSDEELSIEKLSFFPNPFVSGNTIKINIPKNEAGKTQLLQINELTSGRVVYSQLVSSKAQQLSVNLRLASGVYVVRLTGDMTFAPLKLVVVR